jgi:hypothetical protein
MTKRRAATAYHEASHAVIARVLGVEVLGVAMFPTDDVNRAGSLTYSASYYSGADKLARIAGLEIDIKIGLAGPIADARHSKGRPSRSMKHGEVDVGPALTSFPHLNAREGADGQAVVCPLLRGSSPTRWVAPKQHRGCSGRLGGAAAAAATLSGTGSASPRPDRTSWLVPGIRAE